MYECGSVCKSLYTFNLKYNLNSLIYINEKGTILNISQRKFGSFSFYVPPNAVIKYLNFFRCF